MKGRAMLVGKVARHVIGPTAIHRLSISKLTGPVVQVYESTQRTRCRCADLLVAPIGSGRIRDAKKKTACEEDAEMDIHLDICIIFFFSPPSWADATPATAPIGSGCIRDVKKRLHARTMQRWTST